MPKSVCPRATCTANWPIAQNKPRATGTEIAVMYLPRLRTFHQARSSFHPTSAGTVASGIGVR